MFITISQYKNIDVEHLFCSTNNDIYISNKFFNQCFLKHKNAAFKSFFLLKIERQILFNDLANVF